jgi:hypothetical protein
LIIIDREYCIELLDKAVAERGEDYIYTPIKVESHFNGGTYHGEFCLYVDTRTGESRPSCIAGMVLYLAGLPIDYFKQHEGVPISKVLWYLSRADAVSTSISVREALQAAQDAQDGGRTWGAARLAAFNSFSN